MDKEIVSPVISLERWKANKAAIGQIGQYQNYLSLLTFSQIISETNDLTNELKNSTFGPVTAKKAMAILMEIKDRIKGGSFEQAGEVKKMIKYLETICQRELDDR